MKKLFFLIAALAFTAPALHAQLPQAVRAAQIARRSAAAEAARTVSHSSAAAARNSTATYYRLLPPQPGSMVQPAFSPAQPSFPARKDRPWLQQLARDIKARHLREERTLALQEARTLARQKAALPQLKTQEALYTADLSAFAPSFEIRHEKILLPLLVEPGFLYRGLALETDGYSIANILENGLRIEDAGDESTTLLTAYASHSGVAHHIVQTAQRKVTNLTVSPHNAQYWLSKRLSAARPIPVVVQVSGRTERAPVVLETQDIPASSISNLVAKLNINGQAVWCKIERVPSPQTEQPVFKITPYERIPVQEP